MGMAADIIGQKHVRLALIVLLGWSDGRSRSGAGASAAGHAATARISAAAEMPSVVLTAGRSTVLASEFDITRIAITNPAVADAVVVAPREILIDGKTAGTISLILWGRRQTHAVRHRRAAADPGPSAAASGPVPRRGYRRDVQRRRHDPLRNRVEYQRHAARRRNRASSSAPSEPSSTCCRCPAAARASRSCCRFGSLR